MQFIYLLKKEQSRQNNPEQFRQNNLEQSHQKNLEQSHQNNPEQSRQNNPEKSYTEKKAKHELSGWAMLTSGSFDKKEDTLDYYRGKDCIEKLCKTLKQHAMNIINYEKKETIPLTYEENRKVYVKESFARIKMMEIIKIEKRLKITVITQEKLEELLIAITI